MFINVFGESLKIWAVWWFSQDSDLALVQTSCRDEGSLAIGR